MIRNISPEKNNIGYLLQTSLNVSKIDYLGILSQLTKISNSPEGITLFRGNRQASIKSEKTQSTIPKMLNRHGALFQGLNSSSINQVRDTQSQFKEIKNLNLNLPGGDEDSVKGFHDLDCYLFDNYQLFPSMDNKKTISEVFMEKEDVTKLNTGFKPDFYRLSFE